MNKTFWIGFIVVYIVWQAIDFVVHGVMLSDAYTSMWAVFRPEGQLNDLRWMMYVSSAAYLLLFCYIFTRGYEAKGVGEGLRYGLLMGLFLAIPMAVDSYAVYPLSANLAVIWFVTGVVSFMIAGAVFAAIFKPGRAPSRVTAAA